MISLSHSLKTYISYTYHTIAVLQHEGHHLHTKIGAYHSVDCPQKLRKYTPFPDQPLLDYFLDGDPHEHPVGRFTLWYPETLATYMQVAEEMQKQGLIPLVHGRKATWYIPELICRSLGFTNYRSLRHTSVESQNAENVREQIDEIIARQQEHILYRLRLK